MVRLRNLNRERANPTCLLLSDCSHFWVCLSVSDLREMPQRPGLTQEPRTSAAGAVDAYRGGSTVLGPRSGASVGRPSALRGGTLRHREDVSMPATSASDDPGGSRAGLPSVEGSRRRTIVG